MFDEGKDITPHLALSNARRPGHEQRRVNVDFPSWIIESLDGSGEPPWSNEAIDYQAVDCRAIEGRNEEGKLSYPLERTLMGAGVAQLGR